MTFALLALLGGWWTVLISRLVEENHALRVEMEGPSPAVLDAHLRRRVMLLGESAVMSGLALSLLALAWRSTVGERAAIRRMEGVLAASTHELKTPVAGVRALLESLQSGVLPPDRMAPYLGRGLDAIGRLEHLIEGILAWQAAVAAPGEGTEVRLLRDWLTPILDHRVADGTPDEVVDELGGAGALRVHAAADPLRVVVENLLDNARKYGGGRVRLRGRIEGQQVLVDVIDGGDGFPPEEAEALFEPYQRRREGIARHGTGLGLYLSRTLARSMGGDLRAASDGQGSGATFTLVLRKADG